MLPLIFIAIIVIAIVGIWLAFNLVGLILTLVMAGIVGWIADQIVPGEMPYGFLGAIGFGLLGSLIFGHFIHFGPSLFHIALIPGIIGAAALAFGVQVYGSIAHARHPRLPGSDRPRLP